MNSRGNSFKRTVLFTYSESSETHSNKASSRLTFVSSSSQPRSSSKSKSRHLNKIEPKTKVVVSPGRARFESGYGSKQSNERRENQQIGNNNVHPYFNTANKQNITKQQQEQKNSYSHVHDQKPGSGHRKKKEFSQNRDRINTAYGFSSSPTDADSQQPQHRHKNKKEQEQKFNSIDYAEIKPTIGWNKYFNLCGMDHGDSFDGCKCNKPCKWAASWTKSYQPKNKIPYQKLLREKAEIVNSQQIEKDLARTFPNCPTFSSNPEFRNKLRNILIAYSIYDHEVGYVQGMNVVAAVLLYHVKEEDKSFWTLVELMDEQELRMIYLAGFQFLNKHIGKIKSLISNKLVDLSQHMEQMDVTPDVFLYGWLLSLMSNCIPLEYMHLVVEQFRARGWLFIYQLIITYLAYVKEPLLLAGDSSELLSQLNNDTAKEVGIDWDEMIRNCHKVGNRM